MSLIIPKTIYLINWTNNKFKISFDDGSIKIIEITINNYDVDTLATTIKNLVNYWTFDIQIDNSKFKYVLSWSQNFSIEFLMILIY